MKSIKKGHITVKAIGASYAKFISAALASGIDIWDIKCRDGYLFFMTYSSSYLQLSRIALKKGVHLKAEKRSNTLKFKRFILANLTLFIGLCAFLTVILYMSSHVWDIRFIGLDKVGEYEITEILEKNRLTIGADIGSFSTEEIELDCLLDICQLSWIGIEVEGSVVNVRVSEVMDKVSYNIPLDTPCNVIASHSGVIVSSEVYKGMMLLTKGSGVNEGDIIVSGTFEDGGGNVILQHADAKIIAEYTEEKEFYMPFCSTEYKKTDDVVFSDSILTMGFEIPLPSEKFIADEYRYNEEISRVELWGMRMPWKIKHGVYTRYEKTEVIYTHDDVKRLLNTQVENYERNFLGECEIMAAEKSYTSDDDGMTLTVEYVLRSDIARLQEIYTKS